MERWALSIPPTGFHVVCKGKSLWPQRVSFWRSENTFTSPLDFRKAPEVNECWVSEWMNMWKKPWHQKRPCHRLGRRHTRWPDPVAPLDWWKGCQEHSPPISSWLLKCPMHCWGLREVFSLLKRPNKCGNSHQTDTWNVYWIWGRKDKRWKQTIPFLPEAPG